MTSSRFLWIIAVVLTLVFGIWQRMSGPTYPIYGSDSLGGHPFRYKLERTHAGAGDHSVIVTVPAGASGHMEWREHGTDGPWTAVELSSLSSRQGGFAAALPHRGPGQKLDYRLQLVSGDATLTLPPAGFATLRFRNDVPWWVLIPHIIAMLGALLMSTRAALEAMVGGPKLKEFTLRTVAALFVGGFPLGLLVSGYAFGQPWGGFPIGNDATDNKTLVAFVAWCIAALFVLRGRPSRGWVLAAAIVMMLVYMIPHSLAMPR